MTGLRAARLRSLGWHALQRGTALLVVMQDYREIIFVDPRFAGKSIKSAVRVNKLRVITANQRGMISTHSMPFTRTAAQGAAFNVTTVTKRFCEEYRKHYERAAEVDILRIILSDQPVDESDENKPAITIDNDAQGNVGGMEIVDASKRRMSPHNVVFIKVLYELLQ